MTRTKRMVFSLVAIAMTFGVCLVGILAIDMYLHRRAERFAGVNIWGYRGPTVPRKRSGEHRLVVLGGSTAFGYGVVWDKAFPAQLEANLKAVSRDGAPVSVVNLGMNNQGVYSFQFTLVDYLSLQYDAAILYEGYNDHLGSGAPNTYVARRDSPVFRLTGYYPIFPVIFREKAMALRSGGDLDAAYRGDKTVFRPNIASRASAGALEAAAHIGQSLDEQLARFASASTVREGADIRVSNVGCIEQWRQYCGSIYDAIEVALAHGKKVLVAAQPYRSAVNRSQQGALREMLEAKFAGNPSVRYVNFGELIDLDNAKLAYDTMHLTEEGNAILARHLVAPVTNLMPDVFNQAQ